MVILLLVGRGGSLALSGENSFADHLFSQLPDRYDTLAEVLSFGQNRRWRRELVRQIAAHDPGIVLDVATGTAGVAIALARQTRAEVVGVDLSQAMLARGRERVRALGLEARIQLEPGRAEELPFADDQFDAVSFTYLLRYVADPAATLREMARVLKPGGVMASLDFLVPPRPFWRAPWIAYTRLGLPLAAGLLGGRPWFGVGRFLGPNIKAHCRRWPPADLEGAWGRAGMEEIRCLVMSLGGGLVMWGRKIDA
jgi:demethylmenaquinone methyltransferase/2-methoxy-6-polyprenyl-1,4-benzoquinol methylase